MEVLKINFFIKCCCIIKMNIASLKYCFETGLIKDEEDLKKVIENVGLDDDVLNGKEVKGKGKKKVVEDEQEETNEVSAYDVMEQGGEEENEEEEAPKKKTRKTKAKPKVRAKAKPRKTQKIKAEPEEEEEEEEEEELSECEIANKQEANEDEEREPADVLNNDGDSDLDDTDLNSLQERIQKALQLKK
jgi:outer membrane biosynthesis protein TonB